MSDQREDDADVLMQDEQGRPLLMIGRDHSTPERGQLVTLHLHGQSLLMGARWALAASEALSRYAVEILAEQAKVIPMPASSTRH